MSELILGYGQPQETVAFHRAIREDSRLLDSLSFNDTFLDKAHFDHTITNSALIPEALRS